MNSFAGNLRQEVLCCKLKDYTLEHDLRNLDKICGTGANEAVVFYCARILEAIIKQAHFQFFSLDTSKTGKEPKLVEMEKQLYEYNLLQQNRYYWTMGLRLLGNKARHELRRINRDEAALAMIFLEFILAWYFCDVHFGPRLPTIYKGQSRNVPTSANLLPDLAWALDSSRLNPQKLKVIFGPQEQAYLETFSKNFTFPLLLIDIFIAQEDYQSANRLINGLHGHLRKEKGALKNRYYQLHGLLLSREGKLEDALQVLENEYTRQQNDRYAKPEDETVGILAGVYKRIWHEHQQESFLRKSHETYVQGWQRSRNTYLGINAATTACWLGERTASQKIAQEVKDILEKRQKLIRQKTDSRYDLSYWDMVTLAEACLLINAAGAAAELYRSAFTACQGQTKNVDAARRQLKKLVPHLSCAPHEAEVLLSL